MFKLISVPLLPCVNQFRQEKFLFLERAGSLFYSNNFSPNGPNYTHFKNTEFDRLYEQAFRETDDEKRFVLYQKMDKIIIDQAPIIPLFYDKVARFTRKEVTGLGINPLNLLSLKKVKKNIPKSQPPPRKKPLYYSF